MTVALFSAASGAALVDRVRTRRERTDGGPARAAIVDPTPDRILKAATIAERGHPWRGRDGIWFSPQGLLSDGGTLALLFPGADGTFEPRIDDVVHHFGLPAVSCSQPKDLQALGMAIIGVNRALERALSLLGVRPKDV